MPWWGFAITAPSCARNVTDPRRTLVAALLLLSAMAVTAQGASAEQSEPQAAEPATRAGWREIQLTDVRNGESFTIGELNDRPVILESFAVSCPVCTSQQREIQALHARLGDAVVSVSLNTDPNEDAAYIRQHLARHGFDWPYAVSPPTLTRLLVAEFGNVILNAPSAPVILVCPGGQARLLNWGVKSADRLQQELQSCS